MERQDKNMLGANYKGHDLIFIISQPRSGSTLLQRVLAGHPDVATSAETWLMLHPVYESRKRGLSAPPKDRSKSSGQTLDRAGRRGYRVRTTLPIASPDSK